MDNKKIFKGTALELLKEVTKEIKWHEKLKISAQAAHYLKKGELVSEEFAKSVLEDLGWRVSMPSPVPPPPVWSLAARPRPRKSKK